MKLRNELENIIKRLALAASNEGVITRADLAAVPEFSELVSRQASAAACTNNTTPVSRKLNCIEGKEQAIVDAVSNWTIIRNWWRMPVETWQPSLDNSTFLVRRCANELSHCKGSATLVDYVTGFTFEFESCDECI